MLTLRPNVQWLELRRLPQFKRLVPAFGEKRIFGSRDIISLYEATDRLWHARTPTLADRLWHARTPTLARIHTHTHTLTLTLTLTPYCAHTRRVAS